MSLLEKCHDVTMVLGSKQQESTEEMETKCTMLLYLLIQVFILFDLLSVDTTLA